MDSLADYSTADALICPTRSTHVEVNLTTLVANFKAILARVAPARVMPIIKANAYGHGLVAVARCLVQHGADTLGVAILDEGLALRQAGVTAPILVLGGHVPEQVALYLQHDMILTVSSVEDFQQVERIAAGLGKKAQVHMKIDTGMARLGVPYYEAESLLQASLQSYSVEVGGIFSHFASAESADLSHARLQLERFQQVLSFYEKRGLKRPLTHMANSGAILQLPDSYFDMVRPGILLYGVYPNAELVHSLPVQPALTWKARAVLSKVLPPYHPVSYGSTWQSDHPVHILTIPLGYGDGYFRRLSNQAQVLICGRRYSVVGSVCMDQFLVNTEQDKFAPDEDIILLGESQGESITADELALLAGTIPYEILTNINTRVPRLYRE